ncbi:PREDICTED: acyl-coenzyme A thioesterase 13-like isoform X1 [Tarenaya hassleriana]|uniref:acyl-coenzyme A thioesterase 13-like isoform X1 n=1 Tax=Tarenaya hassleriana TaxID=28532 RepID=UPI00053C714C|nr:PREDICTED: acyl-coenzyme A thioesterase 13-like isoform X1 [Tarenaya hassleriana]
MEKGDKAIRTARKYLRDAAQGRGASHVESIFLHGLELVHVGRGIVLCHLRITDRVLDGEGNWSVGAIAAMIDTIGPVTTFTYDDGRPHATVDCNSSFLSTAKIHEEVEIEGKVVGRNGELKSAKVEIRRRGNGDLMATGRLWMAPLNINLTSKASEFLSKL